MTEILDADAPVFHHENINHQDDRGRSVLMRALFETQDDEDDYDEEAYTSRRLPVIKSLLAGGADINKQDENGDTALMYACICSPINIVEFLLSDEHGQKVNVDHENLDGVTALMTTIVNVNDIDTVKLLVEHGADINKRNRLGDTVLTIAVEFSPTLNAEVIRYLVDRGAEFDETLISKAAMRDDKSWVEVVKCLRDALIKKRASESENNW